MPTVSIPTRGKRNIVVLWMPLFSMELLESRYAPKDWERYLHRMYYGKVYYWFQDLLVQPVKFEDYLLESDWWTGKRYRSKRFVTPALLPQHSILDLVPRWRSSGANRGKTGEMEDHSNFPSARLRRDF